MMRAELEKLQEVAVIPLKVVKPFEKWENSEFKNTTIELRLLDAGENLEITELIGNDPLLVQALKSKVEILARAIESVNGKPPCTAEDLERYNKENKTNLTFLEYKKNIISKWNLIVLNRLDEEYRELMDDQIEVLTGVRPKRDTVNATFFEQPPTDAEPEVR